MSRGDCGDLLKVSVSCTAYRQTQALLLKVVSMLKAMKQRCHLPICLNFIFQTTRNFSRAMAWKFDWSFPCSNLPCCVKVLHFTKTR